MLRIDVEKLKDLIATLAFAKTKKGLFNVVEIDFRDDGAYINMTDSGGQYGTVGVLYPSYFIEYEALGRVKFPVEDLLEFLRVMKHEGEMSISVTDEDIILESSYSRVKLRKIEEEVNNVPAEHYQYEWGMFLKMDKLKYLRYYTVEISQLEPVIKLADETVSFELGERQLVARTVINSVNEYVRKLPTINCKIYSDEMPQCSTFHVEILERIVKNVEGTVNLVFTNLPLIIAQNSETFKLSFFMMPTLT